MPARRRSKSRFPKLILILIFAGAALLIGDSVYDRKAPETAIAQCGPDNVKSVTTQGLYKVDIECQEERAE